MPVRVAIADDQPLMRAALRTYVESFDDLVFAGEAKDGHGAILLAESLQADVLLLDLTMPNLDGLAALPRIRAANPAIEVIVLSALPDEPHARLARQAGARAYLRKPASPDQVIDAIRAAVGRR